jgi:MFS family permease
MGETNRIHYAWLILLACIGFYAVTTGIMCNTAGIFLAPVMQETGWTRTAASFYLTIFPLVAAVMQPIAGAAYKKYNPRMILTVVVLIFCLAYIATSRATTVMHWNIFGVIYGITAGFFMYIPTPWLINNWFRKNTGLALGITGAALSIFAALTSPILQDLITTYGWRTGRLVLGIVGLVISVPLTFLFVRKSPADMGLMPYGAETSGAAAQAAAALESSGVRTAKAVKSPAFYFLIILAGIFCMCASFFQQIPSYASFGPLGAAAGAMAVSIVMVGGIIGKFFLGWLNDRVGIKITGIVACLGGAIGILVAFMAGGNVTMFYLGLCIFGVGYSALTIVSPLVTRNAFGAVDYSQIYSWITMSIFLFSAAAPLIYARIYDTTGTFTLAFILVIAMYILGSILVPVILSMGKKMQAAAK